MANSTIYDQLSYHEQLAEHIRIARRDCNGKPMRIETLSALTGIPEATLENIHRPCRSKEVTVIQLEKIAIALNRTFSELKPHPKWVSDRPFRCDNIGYFRSENYESLTWLEQLSQNVRIARVRQGMTIGELAARSNVTCKQWQYIQEGQRDITCHELDLIAKALGADFYQLKPNYRLTHETRMEPAKIPEQSRESCITA